jgi:hypothetical protein
VRLQFYVSGEVAEKLERVGAMLGHSRGKAAAFLLAAASETKRQATQEIVRRLTEAENSPPRGSRSRGMPVGDRPASIVLMQMPLETRVARRIEWLAKKNAVTQARVCAWLLDRAVRDQQWIANLVNTRLLKALAEPSKRKPSLLVNAPPFS